MKPIVAFLTDFGTRDHYAGVMKGVVLSLCPDATVVDVTHELPVHDITAAAYHLAATYKYFPPGTIFVTVVDPGVGSARRGIAVEAGDWKFVAPDNGVLTLVVRETAVKTAVELTERRYARPTISRTFEGRDRFAPAAAWLAKGTAMTALGRPAHELVQLELPVLEETRESIAGAVVRVDRFGSAVSNIDRRAFEKLGAGRGVAIVAAGKAVDRIVATYSEIGQGEVCALFGSTDHLEIASRNVSAAELLGLTFGSAVSVRRV
ncbi:MAG TPA: SAM-dependent chlorinase/fluorinase [Vicinamibacterales bacterium]|nr:SAM-dependent chlorinase/fluorinase [Vicinamibacterales bacterium]